MDQFVTPDCDDNLPKRDHLGRKLRTVKRALKVSSLDGNNWAGAWPQGSRQTSCKALDTGIVESSRIQTFIQ